MDRTRLIAIVEGPFRQPARLCRCAGVEDRLQYGYALRHGLVRIAAGVGVNAKAIDELIYTVLSQECDGVRNARRKLVVKRLGSGKADIGQSACDDRRGLVEP